MIILFKEDMIYSYPPLKKKGEGICSMIFTKERCLW